ncbi:MAG: type secretion protein [Pseudomonadota bacterium]|nr:type secretion protein [Pseudomonadota bacterium]
MVNISDVLWILGFTGIRFYAALSACPLFSDSKLAKFPKALMAISFAIIFGSNTHIPEEYGVFFKLFLFSKEFLVGYVIGVLFSLPLWMVENVGNIIDLQRGESFGSTINQSTQNPSSSISKLLIQGFNVYFVMANGILFFIHFIAKSFTIIPSTKLSLNIIGSREVIIHLFSNYFYWMVILALPVIFLMFLVEISLGLFSSFIQQLNVTTLAMPIKSAVSLFILVFYVGVIYHVASTRFMDHIYQTVFSL